MAVGKGVSVGRSVEEVLVTRAINDVPDILVGGLPSISNSRIRHSYMSRSGSGLPQVRTLSRVDSPAGCVMPQVEDPRSGDEPGALIESLAQYCKVLQQKIDELQSKVSHSDAVVEVLKADLKRLGGVSGHGCRRDSLLSHGSQSSGGGRRMSAMAGRTVSFSLEPHQSAQHKLQQSEIRGMVRDMDSKVVQLTQLFTHIDPLDERAKAATSIAAGIRGFLTRRRYAVFTDSVVSWKWGRSRVFVVVLQHMTSRVSRIDKGISRMKMKRETVLVRTVLAKWYQVVRNVLPLRRQIAQLAEEKRLAKHFKLKLMAFLAFREGCIGTGSIKQARRARRALIEQKRNEIVEENYRVTGLRLLASEDQVMRAVHKEVLANAKTHMRRQKLRHTFDRIGSIYHDNRLKMKQANRYMYKKYAGRVFSAWSNWIFLVSVGLDRRRWVAPGKYEIKYNQKQVDNFSRLRCERFCFVAWKRYTRVSSAVTMGFLRRQTDMIRSYLLAWRAVVKKFKHLLKDSIENWLGYPNLMMAGPFEAWKELSSTARQHREAQERVMKAYRRWKTRQRLATILKTWRHQAVYGSVEGMYSRTNLTKSLAEQKNMTNAMQKLVAQQTLELEKCRDMIKQEVGARGTLEKTLVLKDQEIVRMKISENHTSQEIHRLHALIDAMSKINPRQMKLIKRLQEDFGFTARPITGDGPALPEIDPHAIIAEVEHEEHDRHVETEESQHDAEGMTGVASGRRRATTAGRPHTATTEGSEPPTTVINVLNISPEDESILRRAKWILGRFLMEKDENTPKPLSEILKEFPSLESSLGRDSLSSDSEGSETSEMELARLKEEYENRDGLADSGIFGGRKKHSLVIQMSGELSISKTNSTKAALGTAAADRSEQQTGAEASAQDASITCPHCLRSFEPARESNEASLENSLAPSLTASRKNSDTHDVKADMPDIFDEKTVKKLRKRKHQKHKRHRKGKVDKAAMDPIPLLPHGKSLLYLPLSIA